MLKKFDPGLELLQRLRSAMPAEYEEILERLIGTVVPPCDQPASATAISNLADSVLVYAAGIDHIRPEFACELDALAQIRDIIRHNARDIQGQPIAAQMDGRTSKYSGWTLALSIPAQATPLLMALGAEVWHAMLTGRTLNDQFCTQLRRATKQYGRPIAGNEPPIQDLVDLGFGNGWYGRFVKLDGFLRRRVQLLDPDGPARPPHARVRHALDIIAALRSCAEYPNPKHRQAVLDDSHLSLPQFIQAAKEVRQRAEAGDDSALVAVVCILTRLTPELAMSLPVHADGSRNAPVGLNLETGVAVLNLDMLFPGGRVPDTESADAFEPGGSLLYVPMPAFLVKLLRAREQKISRAPLFGDLANWPEMNSRDRLVAESCKLASSLARASKSTPGVAIRAGACRLVAACLTWDFSVIGSSRMYYARMRGEEIYEGALLLYVLIGWELPHGQPVEIPPVGSQCVAKSEAIAAMFAELREAIESARPGPRACVEALLEFHNVYTRYVVRVVSFCLGLRASVVYRLLGNELRCGQGTLVLHDKQGGDPLMAQPMVLNSLVREQLRQYIAHCHAMIRRLAGAVDPRSIRLCRELDKALNDRGLLFHVAGARTVRPAGARNIWSSPRGRWLPGNCGRHFWQNALRDAGLSSADIDRFMRHRVLALENNSSSQLMSPQQSFARIAAAQENMLPGLGVEIVSGLRRAA